MIKKISDFIDVSFLVKFILLFVTLYYFHIFYLGLTDPQNYYNAFLDHNLNYIKWVTSSINHTAAVLTNICGIDPVIDGKRIFVKDGASVLLEFSCLGLGIMSFWIAFIVAHKTSWKNKLFWTLGGILAIWVLNCCRIAILLIALQNRWKGNPYLDHHDMFNLICYAIIAGFIYLYYRNSRNDEVASNNVSQLKKGSFVYQ